MIVLAVACPGPALAEAGLPIGFCRDASCTCAATQCTCGQVCNIQPGQCLAAQAFFCSRDADCAATCDSFICEQNVCVRGARTDGGQGHTPPGGCAAIPGLPLIALVILQGRRRRAIHASCAG